MSISEEETLKRKAQSALYNDYESLRLVLLVIPNMYLAFISLY